MKRRDDPKVLEFSDLAARAGGGFGRGGRVRDTRGTGRSALAEEAPNERARIGGNQPPPEAKLPIERGAKPKASANFKLKAEPRAEPAKVRGKVVEEPGKTYKHPISGVKLTTPVEDMSPTYEPLGEMIPEKLIHPETLLGGHVIPMRGDPTITGKTLTGVGGEKFEQGVDLWGGPNFPRGPHQISHGAGWASNPGPSTQLAKRARLLGAEGDPVYGAYMKMSPTSGDYSTMMTETLRQMVQQRPPGEDATAAFDAMMRAPYGEYGASPDFPGIKNLNTDWINAAGTDRVKLAQLMDTRRVQDWGFPEVGVARHAITEPDLLNAASNTSGHSVVRFDPSGRVIKAGEAPISHPTYAQQNPASYEGRLPELPLDVLYGPDYAAGVKPSHLAKVLETKPPSVKIDQQTLERVMAYLRKQDPSKWSIIGPAAIAGLLAEQYGSGKDAGDKKGPI